MSSILIIGGSKGLGRSLAELYSINYCGKVYNISRTVTKLPNVHSITCDVTDKSQREQVFDNLAKEKIKFEVVVYCPSLWGEPKQLTGEILQNFIETGPLGFVNSINSIFNSKIYTNNSLFVSIGSISSLKATGSSYPCYSISKNIQQQTTFQFLRQNKNNNIRFFNITLGSLGSSPEYIEPSDVFKTIEYARSVSLGCFPSDVIVMARNDL